MKQLITPVSLRELGIKQQGEVLEQLGPERRAFPNAEIMRCRERYVVLIRDGNLEGVIDRVELASRIAVGGLWSAVVSGIVLGLGFYTYPSIRFLYPVVALFVLYLMWRDRARANRAGAC